MEPYRTEFRRYHWLALGALAQVAPDDWYRSPVGGGNSIAVVLQHMEGNLHSRFTNFLSSDGEKPWRDRDREFEVHEQDPLALAYHVDAGFVRLEEVLGTLGEVDRSREVLIRGQALTVEAALCRSLAHIAYHVGEIVQIARSHVGTAWRILSIPPGTSRSYAQHPTAERGLPPDAAPASLAEVVQRFGRT
jgi:Protein of unknown function (DUF1572)